MAALKAVAGTGDNAGIFITLSTSNFIIEVTVAMYIFAHGFFRHLCNLWIKNLHFRLSCLCTVYCRLPPNRAEMASGTSSPQIGLQPVWLHHKAPMSVLSLPGEGMVVPGGQAGYGKPVVLGGRRRERGRWLLRI